MVKVDGNQINAPRKDKFRLRTVKNSIKLVKNRPTQLIPSWERRQNQKATICADYGDFEIEGTWPTSTQPYDQLETENISDVSEQVDFSSDELIQDIPTAHVRGSDGPVQPIKNLSLVLPDMSSNGGLIMGVGHSQD